MLLSAIALLAATSATPARTEQPSGVGPITATYRADRRMLCIQSGWNDASHATSRLVRRGECRTAAEWKNRDIVFDVTPILQTRRVAASDQVAAR